MLLNLQGREKLWSRILNKHQQYLFSIYSNLQILKKNINYRIIKSPPRLFDEIEEVEKVNLSIIGVNYKLINLPMNVLH